MPDFKVEIRARLAELRLSPVREAEIVEELSQHLEQEYERSVSGGASEELARHEVLEQLNASDLLSRELKRVERRMSQRPVAPGAQSKTNLLAISAKISATRCACWRKTLRLQSSLSLRSHWGSVQIAQSSASWTQCYCVRCRSNIPNNW